MIGNASSEVRAYRFTVMINPSLRALGAREIVFVIGSIIVLCQRRALPPARRTRVWVEFVELKPVGSGDLFGNLGGVAAPTGRHPSKWGPRVAPSEDVCLQVW